MNPKLKSGLRASWQIARPYLEWTFRLFPFVWFLDMTASSMRIVAIALAVALPVLLYKAYEVLWKKNGDPA